VTRSWPRGRDDRENVDPATQAALEAIRRLAARPAGPAAAPARPQPPREQPAAAGPAAPHSAPELPAAPRREKKLLWPSDAAPPSQPLPARVPARSATAGGFPAPGPWPPAAEPDDLVPPDLDLGPGPAPEQGPEPFGWFRPDTVPAPSAPAPRLAPPAAGRGEPPAVHHEDARAGRQGRAEARDARPAAPGPAPVPAGRRDAAPTRHRGFGPQRREPGLVPAARPFRPLRHQDPAPAFTLAAQALDGNLVITADRVIAWYRLPLFSWTFRPEAERLAIVAAGAARIAKLAGRRCHLRVTSRPFEAATWAEAFDRTIRGPAGPHGDRDRPREAMPGPCERHPWRSHPGCPACVPGAAWIDFLLAEQRRLREWHLATRDVYLGVEVTARGPAQRLLGHAWSRAADAERASLAQQAETVRAAVEGAGIGGRPVTPAELQWLLIRSSSIGLPAPLPVSQDPRPAPFSLPAVAPDVTGPDGLAAYTEDFAWAAEPFGQTVQVTRAADGATAHAAVLTITDMTGSQDLAGDSPWIQATDHLGFGVEWSVTFDVLDPRSVGRVMTRQADKIRAQYAHITVEHGQDPPPSMERQMAAVRRIQEEAENTEASGGTYVFAWPRIAVTGPDPDEVRRRAAAVTELYAPAITVKQPPDQFRLLREFVPGEPLASSANRRFMHAELLTAGGAAASVQAGQRHGFPIGATTQTARRPVLWDPFFLMERANRSGLVTVTGSPGGGKSALAGLMAYLLTRAGIPVTVLDPSGMLDRLCRIPAIAAHASAVNLLESPPGTLCPYALIPSPRHAAFTVARASGMTDADFAAAEHAAHRAWQDACRAAEAQRRALAEDILKMLLPPRALAEPGAEDAIGEAVRRAPATEQASPRDVIGQLRALDEYGLENRGPLLASRLETIADHPLARLFFPRPDTDPAEVTAGRRLLTVMTLRGLVIPDPGRRPEDYSVEERLSIPVLHLAAQLLRRMQFDLPRHLRKAAIIDEAHHLIRDSVGVQQINELSRDSRKNNTAAFLVSQNPGDLLAAGVANLVGAAFAFRTEGDQELAATVGLLGLQPGRGHEARIAGLSSGALAGGHSGECLFRDGAGGTERVQVDLGLDPDLLTALSTTPGAAPATPLDDEVNP
jgi:hypothetical protein